MSLELVLNKRQIRIEIGYHADELPDHAYIKNE